MITDSGTIFRRSGTRSSRPGLPILKYQSKTNVDLVYITCQTNYRYSQQTKQINWCKLLPLKDLPALQHSWPKLRRGLSWACSPEWSCARRGHSDKAGSQCHGGPKVRTPLFTKWQHVLEKCNNFIGNNTPLKGHYTSSIIHPFPVHLNAISCSLSSALLGLDLA